MLDDSPKIFPTVLPTENGDYAVLMWSENIDINIVKALKQGQSLYCFTTVGLDNMLDGALAWLKCHISPVNSLRSLPSRNLFGFEYVPSPSKMDLRWLAALKQQSKLELAISFSQETVRLTKLMDRVQLQQYVSDLETAISKWHGGCNYRLALQQLVRQVFPTVEARVRSQIAASYSNTSSWQQVLERCLQEKAVALGLETDFDYTQLEQLRLQPDLVEFLATQGADERSNLIKTWLFAYLCLEYSRKQKNSKLQIAFGTSETGNWLWTNLPYERSPEVLFNLSSSYRYLLPHNWKQLLAADDVLIASVNLATIARLGKVPKRDAFDQVKPILTGAVLERQFGIDAKTNVVIGKEYLQSIEFLPSSPGGLKCLFVIRLFTEQVRKLNLCLVGKIDAANGSIEAIGVEETAEVKLLLFCAAIAYRDVLVARGVAFEKVALPGKSKPTKLKVKDRYLPLRLVARVKHNCSGFGEVFAEPQLLASTLAKFSPYIRSCHLRKLRSGYSASETQIELAASYQFLVPPGYTFVRPTTIGSDSISELRQEFRSISLLNLLFDV